MGHHVPQSLDPRPFGAMARRMSLLGWDVFPERPGVPGVALDGWDPRAPVDDAPAEVRSANVGLRLGTSGDGVFAVRFSSGEAGNPEGMDLARAILGETPFVLVGPPSRVTMLYRMSGDPPADGAYGGGRCAVMGAGRTVTAYGTLPGTRQWRKWVGAHPVSNGPAAAALTDDAALSRFRAAFG